MQLNVVRCRWTLLNAVQCIRLLPTRSPNLGARPPAVDRPAWLPFAQAAPVWASGHVVSFPCLRRTLCQLTQPTLTDARGLMMTGDNDGVGSIGAAWT